MDKPVLILSNMDYPGVQNCQARINDSLCQWYPQLVKFKPYITCCGTRDFRWSRHLVFRIASDRSSDEGCILVKCLKMHDATGRTQDRMRPASNALAMEYRAMKALYEHLGGRNLEGITAIRPLTYLSDIDALVMDYVSCLDFLSLLVSATRPWAKRSVLEEVMKSVYRGGQLLGAIHQIKQGPYPQEAPFGFQEYYQQVQEKVQSLSYLVSGSHVREQLRSIQDAIGALVPTLNEQVLVSYLHKDLYPDNLLQLADGRVCTIDTTLSDTGPIEEDLAKFLVGVDTTRRAILGGALVVRSDPIHAIQKCFLEGYSTHALFAPRILLLYRLLGLLQRWIELLSILNHRAPRFVSSSLQRIRINRFMLSRLDVIRNDLLHESGDFK